MKHDDKHEALRMHEGNSVFQKIFGWNLMQQTYAV